jgi:hypothetical protein
VFRRFPYASDQEAAELGRGLELDPASVSVRGNGHQGAESIIRLWDIHGGTPASFAADGYERAAIHAIGRRLGDRSHVSDGPLPTCSVISSGPDLGE